MTTNRPDLRRLCNCTDCGRNQPLERCPRCGGRGETPRPSVRAVVRVVVRR